MKLFYDHLIISLNDVHAEVEKLEIEVKDKKELREYIEEATHHTVMDTILSFLDKKHHPHFLQRFYKKPHDPKLLVFLQEKIDGVEEKIRQAAEKLKQKLLTELA